MWHYDGYFWGMHFIWWLVWVLLVIWIFATPWYVRGRYRERETPLDILKKRLARGEISKEEFEETRQLLEEKSTREQPEQHREQHTQQGH